MHVPILFVLRLDYCTGLRCRQTEIKNRNIQPAVGQPLRKKILLGINMQVMVAPEMFAHKLCALLDRGELTNCDIFDSWFFMQKQTPINKEIVETRMKMPLADYMQKCINHLEIMSDRGILNGWGKLMNEDVKKLVRTKIRTEAISLLRFYKEFPILA